MAECYYIMLLLIVYLTISLFFIDYIVSVSFLLITDGEIPWPALLSRGGA